MHADRDESSAAGTGAGEPVELPPPARQARLKREYAATYPGLDAGVWYPAAMVAEFFQAWLTRHPRPEGNTPQRLLDPDHFDFRGGTPRGRPWRGDGDERSYRE